jgi:hypothetical protein
LDAFSEDLGDPLDVLGVFRSRRFGKRQASN